MKEIELFLQMEGSRSIEIIRVDPTAKAAAIVTTAIELGLAKQDAESVLLFAQEGDEPLQLDQTISEQGVCDKHCIHLHRCRRIKVTLQYNEIVETLRFPPSATVARIKKRFVRKIDMCSIDATEHVLQLQGCTDRPEPDVQVGSLASHCCTVGFNLVPIKRVEG